MKIMNKSAFSARALLACCALSGAACDRDPVPSGVRVRPAGSVAPPPASEPQRAPEPEEAAGPRSPLIPTSAEQLLAEIRESGKKATLVNAWASWCGPCRRELPMLQALAVNLKPQGVQVVLVSVDTPKDEAKAAAFLANNSITLKSYVVSGSLGDFKARINPRWPGMLPASFLFDSRGALVHFWGGEAFENEISAVVDAFLAGRPIEAETRYGLAPGKVE
jgi:thiol-disulfide isomerase/thioredoxin